mmetsp:Transcript_30722/g.70827  ORF Transcript_30722/g.70827 Transcript_30722/m.70827 type:complete len:215 (+) Transcript_30722:1262-1906(+)
MADKDCLLQLQLDFGALGGCGLVCVSNTWHSVRYWGSPSVAVEDGNRCVRLKEVDNFLQHMVPFLRIHGLEGLGVLGNQTLQLREQLAHQIPHVQEEAHNHKPSIVPELLDHQYLALCVQNILEIATFSDGVIEEEGLVQVVGFTRSEVVVIVELANLGRDLTNLVALQTISFFVLQNLPVVLLKLPKLGVDPEGFVEVGLPVSMTVLRKVPQA